MATRRLRRFNNPKLLTPEKEEAYAKASRIGARATILELGVGEFLKTHMPCSDEVSEAAQALKDSVELRAEAVRINQAVWNKPHRPRRKQKR